MSNIIFDSMGTQVQVQNETGNRLTTWLSALQDAGNTVSYTDYTQPIGPQLEGNQVFIVTTHQWYEVIGTQDPIPRGTCFSYTQTDLGGIQSWVFNQGGSLLLFVNHSQLLGQGPYWPINDIQLAASLGITAVFAAIDLKRFTLAPGPDAPAEISAGVTTIESVDSGGIVPGNGTILVPLPAGCTDGSGLGYDTSTLAFAVHYTFGSGNIIVIGHSGITGNNGTLRPSQGQIDSGDNLRFLMNCVSYLGGA